ncbi:hypothetical protein L7F22_028005 [Adiantum nelumboides]|nr:hypothetical protein [Adiantum nelumboides]
MQINTTNQHLVGLLTQKQVHNTRSDSKVRPKTFSDFPTEDILTWLDHFENVAEYHNWDMERKALEVRTLLEGIAATWADPTMSEDMKLYFLWPRLHGHLSRRVRDQGPTSYHEAIQIAQRIEASTQADTPPTFIPPPTNTQNHSLLDTPLLPTPMDIDVQNTQYGNRRRLPDRDAQGRPRCYACNGSGGYTPGKHLGEWLLEDTHSHIIASASSSNRLVCTTALQANGIHLEALLDSGSSISSISVHTVSSLNLPLFPAPPISVLFGDNQKLYHSSHIVALTFTISSKTFTHNFYVLPHQLFKLTLGCEWLLQHQARLDFSSQSLVFPNSLPIPFLQMTTVPSHFNNAQFVEEDTTSRTQQLRNLLSQFPPLFQQSLLTPQVNLPISHSIHTTEIQPIKMPRRRRSPKELQIIQDAVENMLQKGVIIPSSSSWSSEPHLVKKDDCSYRFCIDFRPLNAVTKHDVYPLPRLDDLLDELGESKYFTSLDLASGYWQIPLNPQHAHKTAFRTPRGLFQFTRMPFGLSDAGSTFQRMANSIFEDLIQKKVLLVYLDDILVHTKTWQEHLLVLHEVLSRIQKYNLQLQFKKCRWGATQLKFLGSKDALDWYNHLSHSVPLIRSALLRNLQTAQGRQKRHHDLQHPQQSYNPGDLVMLYFPLRRPGLSESLMHRWLGPYRITHQIKPTTYQLLRLSNLSKTSAHISRLKPFIHPYPIQLFRLNLYLTAHKPTLASHIGLLVPPWEGEVSCTDRRGEAHLACLLAIM